MRWLQALLSIVTLWLGGSPAPTPAAPDRDAGGGATPVREVGIEVEFAPGTALRGIRANQIYSSLLQLGEVTAFYPNFVIASDPELERFWLAVQTNAPWEAVAAAVVGAVAQGEVTAVREVPPERARVSDTAGRAEPVAHENGGAGPAGGEALGGADMATLEQRTIRVSLERLEALSNLVGELAVEKAHLVNLASRFEALYGEGEGRRMAQELRRSVGKLAAVSGQLQELARELRMVPVGTLFQRFPRLVRDLAEATGKPLVLRREGEDTLLDKAIVEEMADPLLHLIRNAADHGIEPPAERRRAGKPEAGTITLRAYDQGDQVVIEVEDDGRGMDVERIRSRAVARGLVSAEAAAGLADGDVLQFVFHPGFSTRDEVTDISGRGVGMDVVKAGVERLRGAVDIASRPGQGTRVTIRLPLTVSVLQVILVEVGGVEVAVPMNALSGVVRVRPEDRVLWRAALIHQGRLLPLVDLARLWWDGSATGDSALVVGAGNDPMAILVDRVHGLGELVVRPLGEFVGRLPGLLGAAILADGRVALVLDPATLRLSAAVVEGVEAVGSARAG